MSYKNALLLMMLSFATINSQAMFEDSGSTASKSNTPTITAKELLLGAGAISGSFVALWACHRVSKTAPIRAIKKCFGSIFASLTRPFRREWNTLAEDYPKVAESATLAAKVAAMKLISNYVQGRWPGSSATTVIQTISGVLTTYELYQATTTLFGGERPHLYRDTQNTTFEDIAGGYPEEADFVVDYIKNPRKYIAMGARMPRGILLIGKPGTGKTMLARAMANEAEVPFFPVPSQSLITPLLGQSSKNIHELFVRARMAAELQGASFAIIFFDEFDAIGQSRDGAGELSADSEKRAMVNALLTEMDGFEQDGHVLVMAATNFSSGLDAALTRPGRFNYTIEVALPNVAARRAILAYYLAKVTYEHAESPDAILDELSADRATKDFSPAELQAIVEKAAIMAAFQNLPTMTDALLRAECERIKRTRHAGPEEAAAGLYT